MQNQSMKNLFFGSLRSKRTVIGIIALILFVSVGSFVAYESTKADVVITTSGEKNVEVATHAHTVADVLKEADITVSQYDKVSPSLSTEIVSGMTIEWEQAKEVSISVDGNQSSIWTTEKLVKNILAEANIEVIEHDVLSPALTTEVGADNKIDIQKAFQVTLVDGLEERQVWSTSTTVANFLKQQGVQIKELDRVEKNLEDVITPDEKIAVVRVEKVTDVVEESIEFATQKKNDSSLLKGNEKVVTEGKTGTMARTFEIVKENGKVVSKKVQSEKVVAEPKTKVVAVGTKVVTAAVSRGTSAPAKTTNNKANTNNTANTTNTANTANTNNTNNTANTNNTTKPVTAPSSGKEFYVSATAYTPHCAGCSGVTATGINVKANPNMKVIAVDPRVIPLGSKVWVEGYGYAVAGDTGGAIKGNKIDLLVPTTSEARSWGRKNVKIKVLN